VRHGVRSIAKAPGNIAKGAASTAGYIKGTGTGMKDAIASKGAGKEKSTHRLGKNGATRQSKNGDVKPTTRQGKNVQEQSFRNKLAEQHKNKKQVYTGSNGKSKRNVRERYKDASYSGYKHVGNVEKTARKATDFLRSGRSGKQDDR
jgi:hypothetical protein